MYEQPARQYSEDGRWWWDGARWQPVQQAPNIVPNARPPFRLPALLIVGLVAVASLIVGAVGGSIVGNAASQPPPPTLLKVPSGFPDGSQSFLPKVTAPNMRKLYDSQDHPWPCEAERQSGAFTNGKQRMICTAPWRYVPASARGVVEYDDDTHVRVVRAGCDQGPTASKDWCATYFSYVADALFLNQESLRKPAMDWAMQNADSDSSTVIGGVRLAVQLSPHEISFLPQG